MKFGILDKNLTRDLNQQKRCTAKKCVALLNGQKTVHFNLAERGYIIGVRGRQTKSSAMVKHGGNKAWS